MSCACVDLDALSCFRSRNLIDPGDMDYFLETPCECICHAEERERARDDEDAA